MSIFFYSVGTAKMSISISYKNLTETKSITIGMTNTCLVTFLRLSLGQSLYHDFFYCDQLYKMSLT